MFRKYIPNFLYGGFRTGLTVCVVAAVILSTFPGGVTRADATSAVETVQTEAIAAPVEQPPDPIEGSGWGGAEKVDTS